MLVKVPLIPFLRRRQKRPVPAPLAALTLVGAIYEGDDEPRLLTLTFDRAIDTAGLAGAQITVRDGGLNERIYNATGAVTRPSASSVRIILVETGPVAGDDVRLTATGSNGIVAADDGAAWAGVSNVVLPFP
jgi:hypothetical protein